MLFLFKECQKCRGDLVQDDSEWRCFQCGQMYYPKPTAAELRLDPTDDPHSEPHRERRRSHHSAHHLEPSMAPARSKDLEWWTENRVVIGHLDQGTKVGEIAAIAGRARRQIRTVRERLNDLRPSGVELASAAYSRRSRRCH